MITPASSLPAGFEEDIAFVRISSLFRCYHSVLPNVAFYQQKNGERVTAVLSKADSVINLSASPAADFEELRAFVFSLGGRLFCDNNTLALLETGLPFWCGDIMKLTQKPQKQQGTTHTPEIRSLYFGMKQEFELPGFEDFYADIFYRRKASSVSFSAVEEEKTVISSAMTVAENEQNAIVGGVFTLEGHRRKGLGQRVVRDLCGRLAQNNVYVLLRDPALKGFYSDVGFEASGIWTETEI